MTQAPKEVAEEVGQSQNITPTQRSNRAISSSFGNDEAAYQAARSGVSLFDRSHWGRIRVSDDDRLRFLHNQTTYDFQSRQPGDYCETVFVTSTAKTLDLVSAYVQADGVLLLTSPGQAQPLISWMDRYIFFADKVKLIDLTDKTIAFTAVGPQAQSCLEALGWGAIASESNQHRNIAFNGVELTVSAETGLALPGFTVIGPADVGQSLWQCLTEAGAVPAGETVWEWLRIEQGRPMPGQELTEDYNPLEAGLWQTISFTKGCYIGQEIIARLNTYKGVRQRLWGLKSDRSLMANSPITLDGQKVGRVTSGIETPADWRGLAYLRTKAGGAGLTVQIGESAATVVELPFVRHQYWQGKTN